MDKPKTKPKLCPLLSTAPVELNADCMGDRCAWYIPPDHPSLDPNGRCAITYLASISYGVRNA